METTPKRSGDNSNAKQIRINLHERMEGLDPEMENSQTPDENPHHTSSPHVDHHYSPSKSDNEFDISPISPAGSVLRTSPVLARRNLSRSFEETDRPDSHLKNRMTNDGIVVNKKPSPKRVRIFDPKTSSQAEKNPEIKEVEGVRSQLRDLMAGVSLPFSQHKGLLLPEVLGEDALSDNRSSASVDTAALLRTLLPYSSPPLQMNEEGVLFGSGESSSMRYGKHDIATGNSLFMENALLKEAIERERYRRKHCEEQIQVLQSKVLENEQQLAVAISMDKKKELMIEQLDQTLAKIIDGWKKKETERESAFEKLKEEKKTLERAERRQQEVLEQFETELSSAVEALTKEQERANSAEEESMKQIESLENDKLALLSQVKEQGLALRDLTEKTDEQTTALEDMKKKCRDAEDKLVQERNRFRLEREDVESQLENIQEEQEKKFLDLEDQFKHLQRETQERQKQLTALQHELKLKQLDIESLKQEKERMKMELELARSQYETLKTKKELEQQEKLELEFNAKINEIQQEIIRTEEQLREGHRKQIDELNKRHRSELEEQLGRFRMELARREERFSESQKSWENRLHEAHQTVAALEETKQKLEMQRGELLKRLEGLMHQHWEEAISLIKADGSHWKPPVHEDLDFDATSSLASVPLDTDTLKDRSMQPHDTPQHPSLTGSLRFHSPNLIAGNQRRLRATAQEPQETYPVQSREVFFSDKYPSNSTESKLFEGFASIPKYGLGSKIGGKLQISATNENAGQVTTFLGSRGGNTGKGFSLDSTVAAKDLWHLFPVPDKEQSGQRHGYKQAEDLPHPESTPVDLNYVSSKLLESDITSSFRETLVDQERRELELSSYIEKLLQRSPGHPVPQSEETQIKQSGSRTGRHTTAQIEHGKFGATALPAGSNQVSRDSNDQPIIYQTPTKSEQLQLPGHAFKKSILKDQGARSRITVDTSTRDNHQQETNEDDIGPINSEHAQLLNLVQALGIDSSNPLQGLNDLSSLLEGVKRGIIQAHVQRKADSGKEKANKSSGPKSKQQSKGEVFARLRNPYGLHDPPNKRMYDDLLQRQIPDPGKVEPTATFKGRSSQPRQGKHPGTGRDSRRNNTASTKPLGRTTLKKPKS